MFDNSWPALLRPGDATDLFAAPLPPFAPDATAYSPGNAMWLAELSRWAYRDHDRAAPLERAGLRELWSIARRGTQCALVAPTAAPRFTVLVFRGTDELRDWLTNLRALPRRWPAGGNVHRGFLRSLLHVWHPLRARVTAGEGPLFVTGHSLGGAQATLAAAALRPRAAYTFGAPRVGDAAFDATIRTPLHRVVNGRDLVPRLPPSGPLLRFTHGGTEHRLGGDHAATDGADTVDVPAAEDRRWFDPAPFLADHAPVNYVAALRRQG